MMMIQTFVLLLLSVGAVVFAQTALEDAIKAKEAAISLLATASETAYAFRCTDLSTCAGRCTIPACGNSFPSSEGFHCNSNGSFGVDSNMCGTTCPGLIRSFSKTVVRFPPDASFYSPDVQAFVCSTHRLEPTFQSQHYAQTLKAWAFSADTTGSIRIYPGAPQGRDSEQCGSYDARIRPWFIAASSGPKDVVIVLDRSGSMTLLSGMYKSRMEVAKDAVVAILGTLTSNDFVALVTFSTEAQVLGGAVGLARGTEAWINRLRQEAENIVPTGKTNYNAAFTLAFSQFTAGGTDVSSGCTRVILFLTDGDATDDGKENTILPNIQTLQAPLSPKAHIFTYTMGQTTNGTITKMIACSNNGVFARINDGADPLVAMRQYYQFLATGFHSDKVRWTTPYIDAFGLGEMVTGARAVYDRTNPSVPLMVGVAGADLTLDELKKITPQYQVIVGALIARGALCPNISLTKCQMQLLRNYESETSVCTDADVALSTDPTVQNQPTVAYCNSQNEVAIANKCPSTGKGLNDYLCSSISETTRKAGTETNAQLSCCSGCAAANAAETGVIVGATIGAVAGVAIIAAAVYFVCRKPPRPPTPKPPVLAPHQPAPIAQIYPQASQQYPAPLQQQPSHHYPARPAAIQV